MDDIAQRYNVSLGELWRRETDEARAMRDELHEALVDAFDQQDLIDLVNSSFVNDASDINIEGAAKTIVTNLLSWARNNSRLADVVIEAYAANESNTKLKNFKDRYLSETGGRIPIYFVVASMLLGDISALEDEIASKATKFVEFQQALKNSGVTDWKSAYHAEKRESWRPPSEQRAVIEVIEETFARLTSTTSQSADPAHLELKFVSDEFFGPDREKYLALCTLIEQSGAIIIVDAISLFHPTVRERLKDSALIPRDNVSLLVFSPVNPMAKQLNQLIEAAVDTALGRALYRFNKEFDQGYEVGIGNLLAMQRWLYSIAVPGVAARARKIKPNRSNVDIVREFQSGGR
ncbi:MAG TPA: effector-associated domain EAD1-containing protein [Chloroflexia bacterium]|nr:effector-associated domain EAD1-containing protein [Chloroflexia bacterium]